MACVRKSCAERWPAAMPAVVGAIAAGIGVYSYLPYSMLLLLCRVVGIIAAIKWAFALLQP